MSESAFSRFWNMVKPPEAGVRPAESAKVLELRRRQRRLVTITVSAVVLMAAGVGVYFYMDSAPQRADKEYQEAMKLMRPGKYPDAVRRFTRVLDIAQRPEAYIERGTAHHSLGEDDAALTDFQAAVNLDPSLAEPHNGLALIYLQRHLPRRALEELNQSISLHPTVEAYYERGQILESQGEHQKAIADYDLAISQARDAPYIYLARATAKANLGDVEGAHADRATARALQR